MWRWIDRGRSKGKLHSSAFACRHKERVWVVFDHTHTLIMKLLCCHCVVMTFWTQLWLFKLPPSKPIHNRHGRRCIRLLVTPLKSKNRIKQFEFYLLLCLLPNTCKLFACLKLSRAFHCSFSDEWCFGNWKWTRRKWGLMSRIPSGQEESRETTARTQACFKVVHTSTVRVHTNTETEAKCRFYLLAKTNPLCTEDSSCGLK